MTHETPSKKSWLGAHQMAMPHSNLRFAKYSEGTRCLLRVLPLCCKLMAFLWARFRILCNIGEIFQIFEPSHCREYTLPSLSLSQSGQHRTTTDIFRKAGDKQGTAPTAERPVTTSYPSTAKGPPYLPLTGMLSAQNHLPISNSNLLMHPKS